MLGYLGIPPAAQPPRIDPQELTLGALIGEGGFGKVPSMHMRLLPIPQSAVIELRIRTPHSAVQRPCMLQGALARMCDPC